MQNDWLFEKRREGWRKRGEIINHDCAAYKRTLRSWDGASRQLKGKHSVNHTASDYCKKHLYLDFRNKFYNLRIGGGVYCPD